MNDILVRLALRKQKFVDFLWENKDLFKRHNDYAYAHFFFFFFLSSFTSSGFQQQRQVLLRRRQHRGTRDDRLFLWGVKLEMN